MKQTILTLLAAIVALATTHAENYPYRSDYLFVTVPDHADWLYATGEEATIEVQLYQYGIPLDATIEYSIANDEMNPDKKGTAKLHNGRTKINIGTKKTPGFRDLRLVAKADGREYRHHVKVGFSVGDIAPWTQEPKDFADFWQQQLADMRKSPLKYTLEPAPEYSTDKMDCQLVKLCVDGKNRWVYAYLFVPRGAAKGSCPAVMCPPGAGIKTIKEPLRHRYYAEGGMIRLEMEIHGLDPRLPQSTFTDISNAFNGRDNGYLLNNANSRERYYMRSVYLAMARALDMLASLPEWDGKNLAVQGGSQGGALALVAAALDKRVNLCCANHPALSDMAAYSAGLTGGYPHLNRVEGLLDDPQTIATLAYYDVVNFARHIDPTCKVRMTWGYNDDTCPPTTSYAVWNTLHCPKEALLTPINEHWTSETTERSHYLWIKENLK